MYLELVGGIANFNNISFCSCSSGESGGGIYSSISGNGEVTFSDTLTLEGCYSSGGDGGGIYWSISGNGEVTFPDTLILEGCYSSGGNGGGNLFI
jgi:predicted outer membrane repeat protein